MFDGKRLCDAEDERAREMCTGGLMFVAAEDNVVIIEPKPNVKVSTCWPAAFEGFLGRSRRARAAASGGHT